MSEQNDYLEMHALYHHGLKGMRWGIRRFQNEDGTLTTAGRERYGVKTRKVKNLSGEAKNKYNNDVQDIMSKEADILNAGRMICDATANRLGPRQKSKKINPNDYSNISDDVLQKRVKRLQLESQYGELTGDTKYRMNGREITREILQDVGAVLAIGTSGILIAKGIKYLKG